MGQIESQSSSHKTSLDSDTSYNFGRGWFPKPLSGSIIHQKHSQNSWEAVLLTVTDYHRERIQTEISQGKRHTGQTLEGPKESEFLPMELEGVNLPCSQCVPMEYCPQGSSLKSWCLEFLLELNHIPSTWPLFVSSPSWRWGEYL